MESKPEGSEGPTLDVTVRLQLGDEMVLYQHQRITFMKSIENRLRDITGKDIEGLIREATLD